MTEPLLLDKSEVRQMLGITSRMSWKRFLASDQGKNLPKPVLVGNSPKWHRDEIMFFIRHLERTEVPKA